ncbi:ribosomal protein L7/L12 [Shewanella cyperi]|uniref:Ribosomal protein L7/L12 n=1 Tax=Shewanella cyperi TaxID=2814292 RepID=A0A975ALK7_9GAMM|nr:ribosomal protein L7/L12 [Shewanella cyperi]QSX31557.1 ribosomal protein L7/L12 [Shewanella cyperi]QSX42337.1 ribosomal protein L7/L12 [Shewanella cyperi]
MDVMEPEVVQAIKSGRKIEAIKRLRELRGIGLKEAKQQVERYARENHIEIPTDSNGSMVFLLLVILVLLGYFAFRYLS